MGVPNDRAVSDKNIRFPRPFENDDQYSENQNTESEINQSRKIMRRLDLSTEKH